MYYRYQIALRLIGYLLSLGLTLIAYFIIVMPEYFGLSITNAMITIFCLALTQAVIQLAFFIDVWKEEGGMWNTGVFASTVSIIFIVVFFSIWIINELNYNMR